jgi:hypothetical protein
LALALWLFGTNDIFSMELTVAFTLAALVLLNCSTTALVVVCTEKRSWIRPLAVLFTAYLGYQEFLASLDVSSSLLYNGVSAGGTFLRSIYLFNLLWIDALDLSDFSTKADASAALQRLPAALLLTFNPRGIGTRWKTKTCPAGQSSIRAEGRRIALPSSPGSSHC